MPQSHAGVYHPESPASIRRDVQALFTGPTGGARSTWSGLFNAISPLAKKRAEQTQQLVSRIALFKKCFSEQTIRSSHSEQHYTAQYLEGSDAQKVEAEKEDEDKAESGAAAKRRRQRERKKEKKSPEKEKDKEQEKEQEKENSKEPPPATLSQTTTTKSHAPGEILFSFNLASKNIDRKHDRIVGAVAATAEAEWARVADLF